MKKTLSYIVFTLMCMNITISPSNADTMSNTGAIIDSGTVMNTGTIGTGMLTGDMSGMASTGSMATTGTSSTTSSLTNALDSILSSIQSTADSGTTINPDTTTGSTNQYISTRRSASGSSTDSSGMTFDAAPIQSVVNTIPSNYAWTPWQLIMRAPMLAGFAWTGAIAYYITPDMYIGTPLSYTGTLQSTATTAIYPQTPLQNNQTVPVDYKICILGEMNDSFGPNGVLYKGNTYDELRDIAKYCAVTAYGSYFQGKSYTTREEFLMALFTMFGENASIHGTFGTDGRYVADPSFQIDTGFDNVDKSAWFAPYLALASQRGLVPSGGTWTVAQSVSNSDISNMLGAYSQYIMDTSSNDVIKHAVITTNTGNYTIDWNNDGSITIQEK